MRALLCSNSCLILPLFAAVVTVIVVGGYSFVPVSAADEVVTVQSGNWSESDTWDSSAPPQSSEHARIKSQHTVTYDMNHTEVAGITVEDNATLKYDPDQTGAIDTGRNVLVYGTLAMKPASQNITHTLRFINVDETQFQGGGMDVLESDVGLWLRGDSLLDVKGSKKTSWTNLTGSAQKGDTEITVDEASNWKAGDEIVIAPTQDPAKVGGNAAWRGFDRRTIQSVSGTTITLDEGLDHSHPAATSPNTARTFTAEVMNLTRNVRIEGTGDGSPEPENNGRAHIQMKSTKPQDIRYTQIRHMGPRQNNSDDGYTHNVVGRYPLHFHHAGDASRGSLVKGVAVWNGGSHAYVPHASHGVTFKDTVAYDIWEPAYWWDPPDSSTDTSNNTHDVMWDRTVAADVKQDPLFRGYSVDGYTLGSGKNNTVRDSVAVGIVNRKVNAGGFHWPSTVNHQKHNVWQFHDNVAHNNRDSGISVWQNDNNPHIVEDSISYRNAKGINQGAYGNRYVYRNIDLFDNKISLGQHSRPGGSAPYSNGYGLIFDRVEANNPLLLTKHVFAPSSIPALYLDCSFPSVKVRERDSPGHYDFVRCGLEPDDFEFINVLEGMRIRVQREDGTAYKIDDQQNVSKIEPFYHTPSDHTPPQISNIHVVDVTDASATLMWSTDQPATEFINYNKSTCTWCNQHAGRDLSDVSIDYAKQHKVTLNNLDPATDYTFGIQSRDEAFNVARADATTFTTASSTSDDQTEVELTAPDPHTTLTDTVELAVDITNSDIIDTVEYFVDGQPLQTATGEPYTVTWDTSEVKDGMYSITAIATDNENAQYASDIVTVNVRNNPDRGIIFKDNWDGTDGDSWNTDKWGETGGRAGTADLQTNEGRLHFESTINAAANKIAKMNPLEDSEALFRTHMTSGRSAVFRVFLRVSGTWENRYTPTSGYEIARHSSNNWFKINAIQDGSRSELGSFTSHSPEKGTRSWVRFRVEDDSIKVRTWKEGRTEPTYWNLDIVDDSVETEGGFRTALNRGTGSHEAFFDNLTITDLQDPTITLTSPLDGGVVSDTVSIAADASDNIGVAKVEFAVDGSVIDTDTSAPYEYRWDTTTVDNDTHALSARVYDRAGNTQSDRITVMTNNQTVKDISSGDQSSESPTGDPIDSNITDISTISTGSRYAYSVDTPERIQEEQGEGSPTEDSTANTKEQSPSSIPDPYDTASPSSSFLTVSLFTVVSVIVLAGVGLGMHSRGRLLMVRLLKKRK